MYYRQIVSSHQTLCYLHTVLFPRGDSIDERPRVCVCMRAHRSVYVGDLEALEQRGLLASRQPTVVVVVSRANYQVQ